LLVLGVGSLLGFWGCSTASIDLLASSGATLGSGGSDAMGSGGADPDPGASVGGAVGGIGGEDGGDPPPPPPEVLMVVDEVPSSTDDTIEQHLVSFGALVERISELEVTLVDVNEYDLLVVTPSADRADFPGDLATTPVPMISLEPSVVAKLKLGASAGPVAAAMDTEISVKSHPILGGVSGNVKVCSSPVAIEGNAVDEAAVLATALQGMTPGVIFVYESGDVVNDNPLPAARIGISLIKKAPCQTPAVWDIFDSAVQYALESR